MNIERMIFDVHGDSRGKLVSIEGFRNIPFDIKRVYYMWDTVPQAVRGKHAHKRLQQVLICISGSCRIHLEDGCDSAEVTLNNPTEGLYLSSNIWREMYDFSKDAVLMVLASEIYDEEDYIRDYDEYRSYVKATLDSEMMR